ncbi:MAG: hypothetical protein ACR2LX_17040 [Jatrophihabitans sp.]
MVNTSWNARSGGLDRVARLVAVYVVVVLATIAALAVLSRTDSDQATADAWVHAVIVGVFAVVLPVRLRAARRGSRRAVVAVGIIATVLLVVNVVEALIPGLFPIWMRIEMAGIAVLMAAVAVLVLRRRR